MVTEECSQTVRGVVPRLCQSETLAKVPWSDADKTALNDLESIFPSRIFAWDTGGQRRGKQTSQLDGRKNLFICGKNRDAKEILASGLLRKSLRLNLANFVAGNIFYKSSTDWINLSRLE